MGYGIRIGNARLSVDDDGEYYVEVEDASHPDAPTEGRDDRDNYRAPSYTAWGEFLKAVHLADWWSGKCENYPTVSRLTERDPVFVRHALAAYRTRHPDLKPLPAPIDPAPLNDPSIAAYHINRLIWLDYWIAWALGNCEQPAINIS